MWGWCQVVAVGWRPNIRRFGATEPIQAAWHRRVNQSARFPTHRPPRVDSPSASCHTFVVRNPNTEIRMSLSTHLAELAEKHRVLDRRIEQEMARPAATDHEIVRLKLEKLRLKEQIEKLQAHPARRH